MASEEFVILLGEEDTAAPSPGPEQRIALPAESTIEFVGSFYQVLAEAMSEGKEICLDGEDVQTMDTSFAQLLLAAQRKLLGQSGHLRFSGLSESARDVISMLGLTDCLNTGQAPQPERQRHALHE